MENHPLDCLQIPVLLTDPGYCGTLAAARDLGMRGIKVLTTAANDGTPTAKSRHVCGHIRDVSTASPEQYLDSLLKIGKADPGMVLYPTSDDVAWLLSANLASLQPYFRLYSPSASSMTHVLDKRRLFEACCAVGIECPTSYFAESLDEVSAVAETATFPLLLKQRTQIFSLTRTKGAVVRASSELLPAYRRFIGANQHASAVQTHIPYSSWPLMQEFHKNAFKGSYVVSGFVNHDHTHIVAQAAAKVLQYPRTLGIALCMETAPLDEELTQRLLALCKLTGHFGVFQIEFLVEGDRKLLIDFNPRYYHYMRYDMVRGIPFPWLAQLGACGEEAALLQAIDHARHHLDDEKYTFTYRLQFHELLWAQRMTGTMSKQDFSHWRQWYRQNRRHMIDAVADPADRSPEFATLIKKTFRNLLHPRTFLRVIAFDK